MKPSLNIILLLFTSVMCLIGLLTRAFIVVLKVQDWAKGRRLNTCDRILLALAISGTCFQVIITAEVCSSMFWNQLCDFIAPLRVWTGCCTRWLTAALCVFYCVKIVDFKHPLFIRLKLQLPKAVSWLVLVSAVGCLVLSTSASWNSHVYVTQNASANGTVANVLPLCKIKWSAVQFYARRIYGSYAPLLLGILSIIVILSSLYRHTRQMKENASGFSQPQMEAHFGAARAVGFLMLCYLAMSLAEFVKFSSSSTWLNLFFWVVITSSMSAHPAILIFGNTKLRQGLWKVLSPCRK